MAPGGAGINGTLRLNLLNPDKPEPKRSLAKAQRRQDLPNAFPLRAWRLCEKIFYHKMQKLYF
jgi:hypothetical protein